MRMPKERVPEKIRPYETLGFHASGSTGREHYGNCPLCGKDGKFYVNDETGQFSCKAGACLRSGNTYSFISQWLEVVADSPIAIRGASAEEWEEFVLDRCISQEKLVRCGIVWDGDRWALPTTNLKGVVTNLRFYRKGRKMRGLPSLEVGLWNHHTLADVDKKSWPVVLCEGEWDGIALEESVEIEGKQIRVVGTPGAGILKDEWIEDFRGVDVILAYDNDIAGMKGRKRAYTKLRSVAKSIKMVKWTDGFPEEFDVRDFIRNGGTVDDLFELVVPFKDQLKEENDPDPEDHVNPQANQRNLEDFPVYIQGERPKLSEIFKVYDEHLLMTPEMRDGIRVMYAVVLSNQIGGDPLWVHICAPAGRGKTELLMSMSEVGNVVTRSTVTPHSLISGFELPGGRDPSLIPKLFDRTFLIKDFTEVLKMSLTSKQELYSILRGAFDGRVEKQFGNRVGLREYRGYFSMVSGVTHAIYGERGTALGERFLIFRMGKPRCGLDDDTDVIMAALSTAGDEVAAMKAHLASAATRFLEWRFEKDQFPPLSQVVRHRIASLAQLVSMLRSAVDKDNKDILYYRPEHEVGTRLAKQLAKLAVCLALQNDPPEVTEDDMRIVTQCAIHSCVAWNLDTLGFLTSKDGQTIDEISHEADIPKTTLREHLESLVMLGVLRKEFEPPVGRGRSIARYWVSPMFRKHWRNAGMPSAPSPREDNPPPVKRPRPKMRKKK